jgi:hypothetical protein
MVYDQNYHNCSTLGSFLAKCLYKKVRYFRGFVVQLAELVCFKNQPSGASVVDIACSATKRDVIEPAKMRPCINVNA